MKVSISPQTLAEMNESSFAKPLATKSKWVVSHSSGEIDTVEFDKYRAVLEHLMEDDQIQLMGAKEFDEERECRWSEYAEQDYILDQVERFAEEVGYQIVELKGEAK